MKVNEEAKAELEQIRKGNGGFLKAEDVLNYAQNPNTELYKCFEWNDTEAANEYRLIQARVLIRVAVVIEPRTQQKIKAYVQLKSEAAQKLGYRAMIEVLDDEILKQELLSDALKDLQKFQEKYDDLREVVELSPVFSAIQEVEGKSIAG